MSTTAQPKTYAGPASAPTGARSIVPDDPVLRIGTGDWWDHCGLEPLMSAAGWTCIAAEDVDRARWLSSIRRVALVLIAGDHAGRWRALEAVRDLAGAPIAVVADDPDEVIALVDAGVDVVIPSTEPSETLFARLAALIRSADARRGNGVRYLRADDLDVDLWTQQCTKAGEPLALSPTEYRLLTFLMTRPTVTVSPSEIIARVWRYPPADSRNALRITVTRLRGKLGDDPRNPDFVASVRGSGYRFVANVAEVADARVHHSSHIDVTPLLESVTTFAEQLVLTADAASASELLLNVLDRAGVADSMAVFRNDGPCMRLVAARRLPDTWLAAVADGVPFDPSFASAQSVLSGQVVQFADVRAVKQRFRATARQLAGKGVRACHFVPIQRDGHTWGHLGLARRSASPLDAMTMAYLHALCAAFLLHADP